ncbi:hypothetical protein ACPBAA_09815 [Enterococcus faecalis]|uniref:hypothetical protein n=1 Tax=Enterococcus faecalis TaxID=1351 RepID=UPI003CE51E68
MIKFKEFDVGDIRYEEQIEKFQKEHQNAEFIQITGGYTSYEKIWFKYDDRIERPELNENQQIVLDWLKREQIQSTGDTPFQTIFWLMNQAAWDRLSELRNPIIDLKTEQQIQLLRAYADWLEQEEQR